MIPSRPLQIPVQATTSPFSRSASNGRLDGAVREAGNKNDAGPAPSGLGFIATAAPLLRLTSLPDHAAPRLKRAAIYARYSSDSQHESSIDRQVNACRAYAGRAGIEIVATYEDRGKSGMTMHGRDQLKIALADAVAGKFDILLVENVDRLARSIKDAHEIRDRLQHVAIEIHGPRGHIPDLQFAFEAMMGQQQITVLKTRVTTGRKRVVKEGRSPHKTKFGYRKVAFGPRGMYELHPDRVPAVIEVFSRYSRGVSRSRIARDLCGRFPTPGDCYLIDKGQLVEEFRDWTGGMIREILRSTLYAGFLTDGKTKAIRNEQRRVVKILSQPPEVWIHKEVPHCQIIDQAIWLEANKRLDAERKANARLANREEENSVGGEASPAVPPAPKSPSAVSYLLRTSTYCGCCGMSAQVIYGRTRRMSSFTCASVK